MAKSRISSAAFIGEGVQLGMRVSIGPGAALLGPCVVEDDVWIGAGAQLGAPPEMTDQPQNTAWAAELAHSGVLIRRSAVIRENAVIHQGSYRATTVGENSWVLNRAYLAHDVLLGAESTVSAGVSVGGHCIIGDRVNIGMNASIHQRTFISGGCMVGMGTPLARDLPPFVKAYGSPARIHGVNAIGMQRLGVSEEQVAALKAAYLGGDVFLTETEVRWQGALASTVEQWQSHHSHNPAQFEKHSSNGLSA